MKTILITGANGQLGRELQAIAPQFGSFRCIFTDIENLDITCRNTVVGWIKENRPDYIINCAAYTAVDAAESDEQSAGILNSDAVGYITEGACMVNAIVLHISTDYVFDGTASVPYKETDMPNPLSVYGLTKLKGEKQVLDYERGIVVRTSWLYSPYGKNFPNTIRKIGAGQNTINVVNDQIGTPTYSLDFANVLFSIIEHTEKGCNISGLYHFSNEGACSWYDFAQEILTSSGLKCRAIPVESTTFAGKAVRPQYSVLNRQKLKSLLNMEIRHWQEAWQHCLLRISDHNFNF